MSVHTTIPLQTWGTSWHLPNMCWSFLLSSPVHGIYYSAKVSDGSSGGGIMRLRSLVTLEPDLKLSGKEMSGPGMGHMRSSRGLKTKSLFNNHDFRERSRKHAGKCVSCQEICCSHQHSCLVSNSFKRQTTSWLYIGVFSRRLCRNHDTKSTSHSILTGELRYVVPWQQCLGSRAQSTSPPRRGGK